MTEAPRRAFHFTVEIGADTREALSWELRTLADRIERDELTRGVIGGPSGGAIYELETDPTATHDAYFERVRAYLRERAC